MRGVPRRFLRRVRGPGRMHNLSSRDVVRWRRYFLSALSARQARSKQLLFNLHRLYHGILLTSCWSHELHRMCSRYVVAL